MLATKEMARKAVAGELSIDPSRGKSGAIGPCRVLLRRNLHTIGVSLDGTTIGDAAAYSGLLRCNNQWSAKDTFALRWGFCSAENEQVRVAGSINRWSKLSSRQLRPAVLIRA